MVSGRCTILQEHVISIRTSYFSIDSASQMKVSMFYFNLVGDTSKHKKVLLCERKRHTDCGVSSTPSVSRSGVPPPPGDTPPPTRSDGVGLPKVGYTPPSRGKPPGQIRWGGVPEVGYPLGWTWLGYPPTPAGPGWGTPHLDLVRVPHPKCGQTD